ncbi:hypothetical protein [Promicromonospora sukumoe]|uniref:Uncharacterized protein n=1 Tax=Promicromonospora sukumoe TaxID=88382 RepID=A0A7W3J4W7_9MICO|nr:hypothetical protein [Promicromonospora sukumoe]MBA8806358.1 hypothetical protein [Promicromonospora sukumoe]
MTAPDGYRYATLTRAVKDKSSPLRRHLDARYPNTRPVQTDYRAGAGDILVDGGTAASGTVGAAFDFAIRFALNPGYDPKPATRMFAGDAVAYAAVLGVVELAATAPPSSDDFLRAAWAVALCTEVFRTGRLMPGSPLVGLVEQERFTTEGLVGLATEDALAELRTLREVAYVHLHPRIEDAKTMAIGPSFKASALCSADADLIYDGTLLELKSHLGTKNARTGTRADTLDLADLYQLIAYAMFDRDDAYGIHTVGVYSARYGHFVSWPLRDTLDTMAGTTIDLQAERGTVWRLLGGS